MRKLLLLGAALCVGAVGLQEVSVGHGGTYRGPGDTVPSGGGGGGGGGGTSTPGPSGPSGPGNSGPTTPGGRGPGAPGSSPSGPSGASTSPGGLGGPDLTSWRYWWGFNKEPYLQLKAHIHSGSVKSGSAEFYLGYGQQYRAKATLRPSEQTIRQRVVPALIEALENETNNDIITGCLIALAKIGDEQSEDGVSVFEGLITARLTDPVQEVRETAAVALGILANPASVERLVDLASDSPAARRAYQEEGGIDYRTRAFAIYGLGLVGYRTEDLAIRTRIVQSLVEIADSPRMATRDVKAAAIIAIGLVPLEARKSPLAEGIVEQPWDSRQAQIGFLIDFLEDEKNRDRGYLVRAHAPRAAATLLEGAPRVLRERTAKALLKYVGRHAKGEREVRQSCVQALGLIGDLDGDDLDREIRKKLMETAKDSDLQTKFFRLIALAQIGGRPGTGESRNTGLNEVQQHLALALARGKSAEKPWAGLAIGVMQRALLEAGEPQSSEALGSLRIVFDEEKSVDRIGAYALGLGIARDTDAEETLLAKLDSISQDEGRGDIAIALGLMNAGQAKERIQEIVSKSKYRSSLLKNAAIALGLLGDQRIVKELTGMLENEANTLTTQAAIASALGFIGDTHSIDPLIAMLKNESLTDRARGFAAVSLGIVADKEPLPWNTKISTDLNYRATTQTLTSFTAGTGILDIL